MTVLFRFLRNNLFNIYFLLLFFIAFWQVLLFNRYHNAFAFNTSNGIIAKFVGIQNGVSNYFNLKEKNEKLSKENADLRAALKDNFIFVDSTKHFVSDSIGTRRFSYIIAKVIKSSVTQNNNFITLDKGTSSGIEKNMAVIGPAGIAGIVFDVSNDYCLVISVLNSQFTTSPKIPAINFKEGKIVWDGKDAGFVNVIGVSKFEKIKKGMKVSTSGYSSIFPENIEIGIIEHFEVNNNSNFMDVKVKLGTDFTKLDYLYIVKNQHKAVQDTFNRKVEQFDRN